VMARVSASIRMVVDTKASGHREQCTGEGITSGLVGSSIKVNTK
jgi:hypothetical protein